MFKYLVRLEQWDEIDYYLIKESPALSNALTSDSYQGLVLKPKFEHPKKYKY